MVTSLYPRQRLRFVDVVGHRHRRHPTRHALPADGKCAAAYVHLCHCSLKVVTLLLKKQGHNFQGTVTKVDVSSRTLTVSGESVPGWMAAMTMTYHVDKPEALTRVKTGDHIAAKVYDGDVSTLYEVRVAEAKPLKPVTHDALPPVSYVCAARGEESVLEDNPGECPLSGAPRVPVRLVTAYSCLKTEAFIQDKPGICPVDHSELVPITAGLYFTCASDSAVHQLQPGRCADGNARLKAYE